MNKELICGSGHEANGVIIGMVLGDSHIQRRKPTWNSVLMTPHKAACLDYLDWKRKLLKNYFLGKVYPTHVILNDQEYSGFRWDTEANKRLNYHHQDFYLNGRKIAKRSVLNRLTPVGLAIWYADDGWLGGKANGGLSIGLSTNCFDQKSLNNIKDWFEAVLGFKFRVNPDGSIESDAATALRFLAIVKPYLEQIPSMQYKVRFDFEHRRTQNHLPAFLQERLTNEGGEVPIRGYVWQYFIKSAMWPAILCKECGVELDSHRKLYCSAKCGNLFRMKIYKERAKDIVRSTEETPS